MAQIPEGDATNFQTGQQASYIDPNSVVEGTIATEQDLQVEGRLNGKIICNGTMYIAEGASVDAEIEAESIVVSGKMSGTVRCRGRLEIQSTGIVTGDVTTGSLVIIEGARYEGTITMAPVPLADLEDIIDEPELDEDESSDADTYSFLRRFASENSSETLPGQEDEEEE